MNAEKNFLRLSSADYDIDHVFRDAAYGWQGDWEGRALLAFVCHYNISGKKIPCMDRMLAALPEHTNDKLYFGTRFDGKTVDEQQLSGHNWFLRGLIEYAKAFHSAFAMQAAKNIFEDLYLGAMPFYDQYPLKRNQDGGVSGRILDEQNSWRVSSDVGCAFMCVDGVSHYYAQTKDVRAKAFLDKLIDIFVNADMVKSGFQTHTSLSCMRGILTLYQATGERRYLDITERLFAAYIKHGMTLTYENFNWFGRPDTWTEPCAIVDSFILATDLYKLKKEKKYLTLARRIWFNGLQFCQRENGGAGPNTCVTKDQPVLQISMYEAAFCCTMRYAEGLLTYEKNKDLFIHHANAEVLTDKYGRRFVDDKLLVMIDDTIKPIFSCNNIPKETAEKLRLKIIF